MEDDKNLIKKYLAGDEEAAGELVMKYQKQIYAFIYRMINNVEEAKDLTQETFLKAIKGISSFRMEASFKTWLYRIAVNTCLSQIRRNKHEEIELQESIMGNQAVTLSVIIDKEKKEHLKKCLHELPERQRLTILLRAYEGLKISETAKVMKCSVGTVKAHYHNAVKRLRVLLKEKGYEIGS